MLSSAKLRASGSALCGPLQTRGQRRSVRATKPCAVSCRQSQPEPSANRRAVISTGLVLLAGSAAQPAPAEAAAKCDLETAANGIQWCELKEGDGPEPTKGALVRCHYTGRLLNGVVFDSSYERGRPLTFRVGAREVIQGWDIGILGGDDIPPMKAGGKRKLVIPPELAYGSRSVGGGLIPANSTLSFDVEYLGGPGGKR